MNDVIIRLYEFATLSNLKRQQTSLRFQALEKPRVSVNNAKTSFIVIRCHHSTFPFFNFNFTFLNKSAEFGFNFFPKWNKGKPPTIWIWEVNLNPYKSIASILLNKIKLIRLLLIFFSFLFIVFFIVEIVLNSNRISFRILKCLIFVNQINIWEKDTNLI